MSEIFGAQKNSEFQKKKPIEGENLSVNKQMRLISIFGKVFFTYCFNEINLK